MALKPSRLPGWLFKCDGQSGPDGRVRGIMGKIAYEVLEIRRFIARHDLTAFRITPTFRSGRPAQVEEMLA